MVTHFHSTTDEESVRESAFDLILAFDEVLAMGHRETINMQQVKTALEMESHEEKLHNMIRQSKMNEAKEVRRRETKRPRQTHTDAHTDATPKPSTRKKLF